MGWNRWSGVEMDKWWVYNVLCFYMNCSFSPLIVWPRYRGEGYVPVLQWFTPIIHACTHGSLMHDCILTHSCIDAPQHYSWNPVTRQTYQPRSIIHEWMLGISILKVSLHPDSFVPAYNLNWNIDASLFTTPGIIFACLCNLRINETVNLQFE